MKSNLRYDMAITKKLGRHEPQNVCEIRTNENQITLDILTYQRQFIHGSHSTGVKDQHQTIILILDVMKWNSESADSEALGVYCVSLPCLTHIMIPSNFRVISYFMQFQCTVPICKCDFHCLWPDCEHQIPRSQINYFFHRKRVIP